MLFASKRRRKQNESLGYRFRSSKSLKNDRPGFLPECNYLAVELSPFMLTTLLLCILLTIVSQHHGVQADNIENLANTQGTAYNRQTQSSLTPDRMIDTICSSNSNSGTSFTQTGSGTDDYWTSYIVFSQQYIIRTIQVLGAGSSGDQFTEGYYIGGNTDSDHIIDQACGGRHVYSCTQTCPSTFNVNTIVIQKDKTTSTSGAYFSAQISEVKAWREINLADPDAQNSNAPSIVSSLPYTDGTYYYYGLTVGYGTIENTMGDIKPPISAMLQSSANAFYEFQFATKVRLGGVSYLGRREVDTNQGYSVVFYTKAEPTDTAVTNCKNSNYGSILNAQDRGLCVDVECKGGQIGKVVGIKRTSTYYLSFPAYIILECLTTSHSISPPTSTLWYEIGNSESTTSVIVTIGTECTALEETSDVTYVISNSDGDVVYDSNTSASYPSWISSISNKDITVITSDLDDIGVYTVVATSTIQIYGNTYNVPLTVTSSSFEIKIGCKMNSSSIFKPSTSGIATDYKLWSDFSFSYSNRDNTNNCPFTTYIKKSDGTIVSQTDTDITSETSTYPEIDHDETAMTISGYTTQWTQIGTYVLYIEQCENFSLTQGSANYNCLSSDQFTIEIVDSCTAIINQSLSNLQVHVDQVTMDQEFFTEYQDSAQNDGLSRYPVDFAAHGCGPRSYTLVDASDSTSVPSCLTIEGSSSPYAIQLSTNDPADYTAGTVTYKLKVQITKPD